jgi:hypothetical protein
MSQTQTIPQSTFLTMAVNLLYRALLEPSRTEVKKLFRELIEGRELHLSDVRMEDSSTLRFLLSLDDSEIQGRLNYGAFRASVATLVHNIAEQLKEAQSNVTMFSQEDNADVNLFGIPAVTYEGDEPRVMVLGAENRSRDATMMLRLMYLDPVQFQAAEERT